MATPINHRRNNGGKRKVAIYVDEGRLPLRHHQAAQAIYLFYKRKQQSISPKRLGAEMGFKNPTNTSQALQILRRLLQLGLVDKKDLNAETYIPTRNMDKYIEDFCDLEVLV